MKLSEEMRDMSDRPAFCTKMPILDRPQDGERIFKAESKDWGAVERLAAQFRVETGMDSNPGPYGEDLDVLLVKSKHGMTGRFSFACGAVEMERRANGAWHLGWIWIHPNERGKWKGRTGAATLLWEHLESAYGDFSIEAPASCTMLRFLQKVDPEGKHQIGTFRSG